MDGRKNLNGLEQPETAGLPKARVKQPSKFSWIWLVPIIAAIVAGWLVFQNLKKIGPTITIEFRDGNGLVANQTIVRYKGVRIGNVRSVDLTKDLQRVAVTVRLDRSAGAFARAGTVFWVVRPEVGASGFQGLETIVSGPYIQGQPAGNGPAQKSFIGVEEPPILPSAEGGMEFVLQSPSVGSLAHGSPVYYRGVEVGSVQYLGLGKNSATVDVHILIKTKFVPLVRTDSIFWNAGGINVDLRFLGVSISAENFRSVVIGGVAFATPNEAGEQAPAGALFPLHDKVENKWLGWAPSIALTNATVAVPVAGPISPLNVHE